jgi:hypothetical protein
VRGANARRRETPTQRLKYEQYGETLGICRAKDQGN